MFWFAGYFPLALCHTLFASSGVFFFFRFFPPLVLFDCLPHRMRGGDDSLFLQFRLFSISPFLFRFDFYVLYFFVAVRFYISWNV